MSSSIVDSKKDVSVTSPTDDSSDPSGSRRYTVLHRTNPWAKKNWVQIVAVQKPDDPTCYPVFFQIQSTVVNNFVKSDSAGKEYVEIHNEDVLDRRVKFNTADDSYKFLRTAGICWLKDPADVSQTSYPEKK